MKKLFTFEELSPDGQEHVIAELKKELTYERLACAEKDLEDGKLSFEEYAKEIGSDSPIFPECPAIGRAMMCYNKHQNEIDSDIAEIKEKRLYDSEGNVISSIETI